MALTILALATLSTGCAPVERAIPFKPQVDPALKLPCPLPDSPPPRGEAAYVDLMTFAVNAEISAECNYRKVIDLGKSIDG